MTLFLQIWGGLFYLLNKVFLSLATRQEKWQKLRIWGWASFLIGLPAWVIILALQRDWIAATIEFGSAPAMVLGLYGAMRGEANTPKSLDTFSKYFAYILLALGITYSWIENNGITSLSQFLEIGVIVGFLIGTYLLAKNRRIGWLFFFLMNVSMGLLMFLQDHLILAIQQFISVLFVLNGFIGSKK